MSRARRRIQTAKLEAIAVENPPSRRPAREVKRLLKLLDEIAMEQPNREGTR
jgi:hypothetical protein